MIGPDHRADPGLAKYLGGCAVVARRHDDQGRTPRPLLGEPHYFVRLRQFTMNENGVGTGERLALSVQEAVGLRKLLILDADTGDTPLFELAHQTAHVVEVAVTRVAVE